MFIRLCLILCADFLWSNPASAGSSFAELSSQNTMLLLILFILVLCLWQLARKNKILEKSVRDNIAKLHTIIHACPIPLALRDEAENIIFQTQIDFPICFSNSGKNYF